MNESRSGAVCGVDGCGPEVEATGSRASAAPAATDWQLDVISDVICPWCLIGKRRLAKALDLLAPELAFTVRWRPFELNPDMPKEGMERSAYRARKFGSLEKSRALDAQVAAAGAQDGIEFRFDRIARTPNTFDAHRLIWLGGESGVQDAVAEALFQAYFVEGRDLSSAEELADIAVGAGLAPERVRALLAGDEGAAEVRRDLAAARRAGIHGVPCFVLNGYILFSGALQPEQMSEALRQAAAHIRQASDSRAAAQAPAGP